MNTEKQNKNTGGIAIIAIALIWAAVILASSFILKGTGLMSKMSPILGGGAGASIIILGGYFKRRAT